MKSLIDRLYKIGRASTFALVIITTSAAIIMAFIMNYVQSYLWWNFISWDLLQIGTIDALVIALCLAPVTFLFIKKISKLEEENKISEAARKRERLFKIIAENINDVVWILDVASLKFTYVSPSVTKQTGFSVEEFSTKKLDEVLRPNSLKIVKDILAARVPAVIAGDDVKDVVLELEHNTKSGKFLWAEVHAHFLINEVSGRLEVLGVTMDITDRKRASESLLESEEKFSKAFHNSPMIILISDLHTGKLIDVNKKAVELSGFAREEILGLTSTEIGWINEQDRLKIYTELKANGYASDLEIKFSKKNGEVVIGNYQCRPITINGQECMLSIIQDITDRKKAEEYLIESETHYRLLFKNNPAPMLIYEKALLKILSVNESFLHEYGYTEEEMYKKTLDNLYPDDEKAQIIQLARTLKGYENVGDWHHIRKDGSIILINVRSHDIYFEGQHCRVAVITDVTENKRMFDEVKAARNKAVEAGKTKDLFLANMSHELRTPLIGILGYSDLLVHSLKGEEDIEMAEGILRSGKRLLNTLNMILAFTKIEADRHEVSIKTENIAEEIKNIYMIFKGAAKEKGLEFILSLESEDITINTDAFLLNVILENLINNSIKFTQKGSIEISAGKTGNKTVFIKIKDTGIGIKEEDHELIFKEFKQLSEGINRDFQGTGLGLSIAKKYSEMIGGNIKLESSLGTGSAFTLILPDK